MKLNIKEILYKKIIILNDVTFFTIALVIKSDSKKDLNQSIICIYAFFKKLSYN